MWREDDDMTIAELEQEIERRGLDTRGINIGERGNFDECFNLLIRGDGRYEIFYGERGQKSNPVVYETEDEAAKAFLKDVCPLLGKRRPAEAFRRFEKFNQGMAKFKFIFVLGFFIFCILMGIFFMVVCFDLTSWVFWFWPVWILVCGYLAWRWVKYKDL